jgi:hypothetical protein
MGGGAGRVSSIIMVPGVFPYPRQHVVMVHGMRHMRNFKMQWYGDPANIPDKKERYRDKSHVWNQKIKVGCQLFPIDSVQVPVL